jgi:hypothetical protein
MLPKPQYFLSLNIEADNSMQLLGHGDQARIIISVIQNNFKKGGTTFDPVWTNCAQNDSCRDYENLSILGYMSADMDHSYGYSIAYRDVHEIESKRAATMCRVFRMIDKKLKYYENFEGHADSLGLLAFRFSNAIKARGLVTWPDNCQRLSDENYERWDCGQIKSIVNTRLYQWHCAHPYTKTS